MISMNSRQPPPLWGGCKKGMRCYLVWMASRGAERSRVERSGVEWSGAERNEVEWSGVEWVGGCVRASVRACVHA